MVILEMIGSDGLGTLFIYPLKLILFVWLHRDASGLRISCIRSLLESATDDR